MKIKELIRPHLLDLQPYSSARDEYSGKEGVFLDANENPFDTGVNRYPDPLQKKLKGEVAKLKSVSVDNLFFGNGSDECIDLLIRLFCVPIIDKVLSITPSYGMHAVSAKINHIEMVNIPLNDDFTLNTEQIIKNSKDVKIIFLCSPNNPTGNTFSKVDFFSILDNCGCLVVVDEAYIDFSSESSMINELKNYSNLIVLQTFSKAFGLAGLRLGMMFGSKELVGWMNKIKPPYNISQTSQNLAIKKLEEFKIVENQIEFLKKERTRVERQLRKCSIVEKVHPSEANFILIKVKDSIKVYNYLVLNKIIVRNRSNQPLCENCIRITIGKKSENDLMLSKMKEVC